MIMMSIACALWCAWAMELSIFGDLALIASVVSVLRLRAISAIWAMIKCVGAEAQNTHVATNIHLTGKFLLGEIGMPADAETGSDHSLANSP